MDQRAIGTAASSTGAARRNAVPTLLIFRGKILAFYRWQSHGFLLHMIGVGCIPPKSAIQGPRFVVELSRVYG
jgi:hypothetical protein